MKLPVKVLLFVVFLLLGATSVFANTVIYQVNNPRMSVNGTTKDIDARGTKPVIIDGNTLVPLRSIIEGLGGSIEWNEKTKQITMTLGTEKSAIWLDKNNIKVLASAERWRTEYGEWSFEGVAPKSINNVTMVPVRMIEGALQVKSNWFAHNKLIVVYNGSTLSDIIPPGENSSWGDSAGTPEAAIQNLYSPKIGPGLPYIKKPTRTDIDEVEAEHLTGYAIQDFDKDGNPELLLRIGLWENVQFLFKE